MSATRCTCAGAVGPTGEHERWCGTCETCYGEGRVDEYVGYDRASDPPSPIYRRERCAECGGTGRVDEVS